MTTATAAATETTTTAATTATAATTTAAASAANAPDWLKGADEVTLGYVQNKAWRDPVDAVKAYRELEKFRGVPAERLIEVPTTEDEAAWNAAYDKMGRPKDIKEYEFKAPEGQTVDEGLASWARENFHKLGLNKSQGTKLMSSFNELLTAKRGEMETAMAATRTTEATALKTEWGNAHEANIAAARKAAVGLGLTEQMINGLEQTMGFAKTMKFFNMLGSKMGEDAFVGGDTKVDTNVMTPGMAKAKIESNKADGEWRKSYLDKNHPKHASAKKEMAYLMSMAYPEPSA